MPANYKRFFQKECMKNSTLPMRRIEKTKSQKSVIEKLIAKRI
jgi:hypothetical protein